MLFRSGFFNRPGNPYLGPDGKDWPDNGERFAAFSFAAAELAKGVVKGIKPKIVHLHDWQAALAAVYIHYAKGPKTVLTVHNIAFQGQFSARLFSSLGLPNEAYSIDGVEYYGGVSFLKGGLAYADAITTVSPTYADEICTPEFGMGLDGLLRARRSALRGIINGIDTDIWNSATDKTLPQVYDERTLGFRVKNKRELEAKFGLEEGEGIIHGVVSRLTHQKGLDVLIE